MQLAFHKFTSLFSYHASNIKDVAFTEVCPITLKSTDDNLHICVYLFICPEFMFIYLSEGVKMSFVGNYTHSMQWMSK